MLFTIVFEFFFFYNRCIRVEFTKTDRGRDQTVLFPIRSRDVFWFVLCMPITKLFCFTLNIYNLERWSILLMEIGESLQIYKIIGLYGTFLIL